MTNHFIKRLISSPGIQRDGTQFDSDNYIDGQWTRFFRGRPKKIGGYKLINGGNTDIIRNLFPVPVQLATNCFAGRASAVNDTNQLTSFKIQNSLVVEAEIDHTPDDFANNIDNIWNFDLYTALIPDSPSINYLFAQACPSAANINSNTDCSVYFMDTADANNIAVQFVPLGGVTSTGGFITLAPYLFLFGGEGTVSWSSSPGDPTTYENASIAGTKIVAAATMDGGTPAVLFWSLDKLIRAVFVGGSKQIFQFVPLKGVSSILSQKSIVKYNGLYYWIGQDQFYVSNGDKISSLPNAFSRNYFFDNLNYAYANKISAVLVSRWSEIWWFWPKGNATENTDILIYNYEYNIFYDSVGARTCGVSTLGIPYPIMADANTVLNPTIVTDNEPTPTYGVWIHEFGSDKILFNQQLAIPAFIQTSIETLFEENPQADNQLRIFGVETDFVQSGDMTVQLQKWLYANSTPVTSQEYSFSATPADVRRAKTDMNEMGREVSLIFSSNTLGGDFEMGKVLLKYGIGQQNQ